MKKIILSLVLALTMASLIAVPVFAAPADPATNVSLGDLRADQNAAGGPGVVADIIAAYKAAHPDENFGQLLKAWKLVNDAIPGKAK